ncbi:DEAD/DEAH box helicase [Enterobacter bugandensis]|nr:DEAD/DEAH box helicase [Enterobacter bugandensis]EKS7120594.1 DEAD/DEAH box helicase [Enterobacter bugandensis]
MDNLYEIAKNNLSADNEHFDAFEYIKTINTLLDNPVQKTQGRDLTIRALNEKSKFSHHIKQLRAMIRKSGLYPYLYSEFDDLDSDEKLATEIYRSPNSDDFIFHSMQMTVFHLLMNGANLALSAPTSMGKSIIIDSLVSCEKYNTIVIVVPTIALIDETRRRLHKKFSNIYEIIYHSAQERNNEKTIYILTQERVNEREDLNEVDIFVIDEFYKLSFKNKTSEKYYDERVISLNVALSKLLTVSKQFYMIGPNIDFLRGLNNINEDFIFLSSDFNTVALNVFEYNILPNNESLKQLTTLSIIEKNNGQFIIYCKSPKVAESIASFLIKSGVSSDTNEEEYSLWLEKYYSQFWVYTKAIRHGIGLHYGTLPRAIQQYTIDLFNNKKVNILICTSTIIEGVNTNAQHVIIYDNRDGNNSIDKFTHNNIKGRAGRMKQHFIGNVHCLEESPEGKIEDSIVEIPIGLQDDTTPLNLIAGMQDEHVSSLSENRLEEYLSENRLPKEIIKKHASYEINKVLELFNEIDWLKDSEISDLCFQRYPDKKAMNQISKNLLITSRQTFTRNSVSTEIEHISGMLFSYINAETHQTYFDSQLSRIINSQISEPEISELINRELKIIRNVFSYSIPKSLALQQDIINFISQKRKLNLTADYSFIINIFEKFHLPGNISALEEMGVPLQILQKINFPDDAIVDINKCIEYIKNVYFLNKTLSRLERKFIERALII